MLEIEIDGYTHYFEEIFIKDDIKEQKMKSLGITILRYLDEDVLSNIDGVLMVIDDYIKCYEENSI